MLDPMTVGTIPYQFPIMLHTESVDLPKDDRIILRTTESIAKGGMHHLTMR